MHLNVLEQKLCRKGHNILGAFFSGYPFLQPFTRYFKIESKVKGISYKNSQTDLLHRKHFSLM